MADLKEKFGIETIRSACKGFKSRIYGFILFTEQNPHVVKALRDNDYWVSLDKRSGLNWPIFSVKPLEQGHWDYPNFPKGSIGMMIPIWKEPEANLECLRWFGLENSRNLPCFVTFMWDDNEELNCIITKIKGNNKDEVYNSLETIVQIISDAETKILEENKATVNVFREVKQDLEAQDFMCELKKLYGYVKDFKSFFNLIGL